MIEYADLLCESCMEMHEETLPRIKAEYVEPGHVDYTLKLVDVIAPDSLRAAQGAHCAKEDGKYIEFVDASFQRLATDYHNRGINPLDSTIYSAARIGDIAETIGLERAPFEQCVESGKYRQAVLDTTEEFHDLERVYGTPHFIVNGKGYTGAAPYAIFKATIEEAL